MSVSNISSTDSTAFYSMRPMHKPDPAKMAEDLFAKLDSKGQGYLEKADLETALNKLGDSGNSGDTPSVDAMFAQLDSDSDGKITQQDMSATFEKIAAELDGPFPRRRLQGQEGQGQGTMPPPDGQQDSGLSKDQLSSMLEAANSSGNQQSEGLSQLVKNFDQADSNGDGKVSRDEADAYYQANDLQPSKMPPPPSPGSAQQDEGLTKDQLSSILENASASDKQNTDRLSQLLNNFDDVDGNEDGKVTREEAKAFYATNVTNGSRQSATQSSTAAASNDMPFMKQMMKLLQAYSGFDTSSQNTSLSTSA